MSALHHRIRHTALLRAIPDRRFPGTALVIGIEPRRHLANLLQILYGIEPAAKIAHVHGLRVPFVCNVVPKVPDLLHAVHISLVVLAIKRI